MKKIILLAKQGEPLLYIYNDLKEKFPISGVVIEEKIDKKLFLKKRIKSHGSVKVFGQILFQLLIPRILRRFSNKRINELKSHYNLDNTPIPNSLITSVSSVNSLECTEYLNKENPDIIIVIGTRIISKKTLSSVDATFINIHGGITPKYRGILGGYWALASRDKENFGVTIHIVDSGIDTGMVLFQKNIDTTRKDNVITYQYLIVSEGVRLVELAISNFIKGTLEENKPQITESKLWTTPTLWQYLYNRILYGVK